MIIALNPGRTRRIRLGRRRVYTVRIDPETRRVLGRAYGRKVPEYWVGLPWGNVRALERELRRVGRDRSVCLDVAKCREESRDRLGRRRPCRQTFGGKREAFEALDDALGGALYALLQQVDPGSPELADLERHARRGRRRRRLPSWGAAFDWLAPSSRRWRDFDPQRVNLVADAFGRALERGGVPFPGLRLPRQTERLLDAEMLARECDNVAGDATARALADALKDIADLVPF